MRYLIVFIITFAAALFLTYLVRLAACHLGVIDKPNEPRKIHQKPTPLLGGLAPFFAFFVILAIFIFATPYILDTTLKLKNLLGLFIGGLILMIGGVIDDKYNLKPSRQIIFSVLAVLAIIASGIGIREITNPFGGTLPLVWWEKVLFWHQGVGYRLTLPADLFTFVWLLGMIYATKFLDGLDGLVSGISGIGALMIFFLATMTHWHQPAVGMMAMIGAGAFLGFLMWNWHPAKIFLGTAGSTFAGYLLGVMAIISGGKIATALLVMGLPILDALWVILRRLVWEKKSPARPDRKHLHFRLLEIGFSQRKAVLFLYLISFLFGLTTLVFQSRQKLMILGVLSIFMICLAVFLVWKSQKYHIRQGGDKV